MARIRGAGLKVVLFLQATSPAEERNDITVLYNRMTLRDVQETFNLGVSL